MHEPIPSAFLSYTNVDDRQENGKLRQLAKLLEGEVEVRLGSKFKLFVDKNELGWGEPWKKRITQSLGSTMFLIPILTPWYFNSPACREEFELFLRREEQLLRDDLILPLYYIDCPLIDDPTKAEKDEIARLIRGRQIVDWRHWRHTRLDDLRPQVDIIARQLLVAINRKALAPSPPPVPPWDPGPAVSTPNDSQRMPSDYWLGMITHTSSRDDDPVVIGQGVSPEPEDDCAAAMQHYSAGRYPMAFERFQRAAIAGDGTAMYNLGTMLERGLGASVDFALAKAWYEKSADAGVPEALNSIGTLFEYGKGVPENKNEARLWYERAAAAGNPAATINLRRITPLMK